MCNIDITENKTQVNYAEIKCITTTLKQGGINSFALHITPI